MFTALAGLGLVSLLELAAWTGLFRRYRRAVCTIDLVLLVFFSIFLLAANPALWTVIIFILSLYRCFNLARVVTGRVRADYLYRVSLKTSLWLIAAQLFLTVAALALRRLAPPESLWWDSAAALSLVTALLVLASLFKNLGASKPPQLKQNFTSAELPDVTVAIPARNETEDLEECLGSLLASTYPKLEILVLDDCSQNKRTPEIIRGLAHDGVRFLPGKEPPSSWLAKNYAYAQLAEEASSDLLLFCGVDTRFEPDSIGVLVRTLLESRGAMISVLPRNMVPESRRPAAWFMQPNRYAWELAVPRMSTKRQPVLSTCWMIARDELRKAGGFEAVRRKGVPESYFARSAATSDSYRFMRSNQAMGVSSNKLPAEQRATAIRTRYLQLHRRPEFTALISLLELGVLVGPLLLLVSSLVEGKALAAALSGTALVINCLVYAGIMGLTYRRFMLRGLWMLPFGALYDVWLLNYSMFKYEFSDVLWKGRNVCIPVMRVIEKLPPA